MTPAFLFATGVENSNPTIHNGRVRVDEMAKCGHYTCWRDDFDCVQQLGIRFLRYGPPLYLLDTRRSALDTRPSLEKHHQSGLPLKAIFLYPLRRDFKAILTR